MASGFRTLGLFIAMIALFTVVGYFIGGMFFGNWQVGLAIFLVIAAVMNFFVYFYSDRMVLWSQRARVVEPSEAPRLHRIVDKLVLATGLPKPRVAIVPSMTPNAFATGRNPKHAVVAATEGILRALDDDELEGVMAHEFAHVANRDILVMSVAATIAGAITLIARSAFWGMLFGGGGDNNNGGIIGAVLLMILAPIAAILVQMGISRSREYMADATGARMCGKPWALASALEKLHHYNERMPMRNADPSQAHMFIVSPLRAGAIAGLFTTHPPMEERVRRLREMMY